MKKIWITIIVLISFCAVLVTAFFLIGYFRVKPGGIFVDSNPPSSVYINDTFVGQTPYTSSFKAGEITLKIVPASGSNLLPYKTKVSLVPGVQTIVRREFSETEDGSSGDVIYFDKTGMQNTGIFVISTPPNAQVSIDGIPRGFAPYLDSSIAPAEHQITIKAPGYIDRSTTIKIQSGYRLTMFAKLAKVVNVQPSTVVSQPKTYVQILTTPTGHLRLRTAPGLAGEEIAELAPGTSYPYLDSDAKSGWIEIQYEATAAGLPEGITGWVSKDYVKISTESAQPTAIPE